MSASGPLDHDSMVPSAARQHQGHPAGIVSRSAAALLDLVVVACLLGTGYVGWSVVLFAVDPHAFAFPTPSTAVQLLWYEVVAVSYLTITWASVGCSLGQQVLGLRVRGREGREPAAVQSLLRALVCVTFPVGLLGVLVSPRRRALHDVLVSTTVTYAWSPVSHHD